MQFLEKNWQNCMLTPPRRVGTRTSGKPWIRQCVHHYRVYKCTTCSSCNPDCRQMGYLHSTEMFLLPTAREGNVFTGVCHSVLVDTRSLFILDGYSVTVGAPSARILLKCILVWFGSSRHADGSTSKQVFTDFYI